MAAAAGMFMAGSSMMAAQGEAEAYGVQADFTTKVNEINMRRAELAGKEAIKRGEKESGKHMGKVRQMTGSQKVALAAQGISLDQGSAQDIIGETETMGYEDALMIRNNAFKEAMGYGQQAQEYGQQSFMAQMQARGRSTSTMLSGGMQAAGHFASAYKDYTKK